MNRPPDSREPDQPAAVGEDIEVDAEGNVVIPAPTAVAIIETPEED